MKSRKEKKFIVIPELPSRHKSSHGYQGEVKRLSSNEGYLSAYVGYIIFFVSFLIHFFENVYHASNCATVVLSKNPYLFLLFSL